MTTPIAAFPELAANQAQPHLTVNEALRLIDGTIQLSVITIGENDPPVSPADGDAYTVGSAPTGDWAAFTEHDVALYIVGSWVNLTPKTGWVAYDQTNGVLTIFIAGSPGGWTPLSVSSPTTTLGDLIVRGATEDERLAVGTDGQVPVADSTAPLGIRFADFVGGGSFGGGSFISTMIGAVRFTSATPDVFAGFTPTRTAAANAVQASAGGGAKFVSYLTRLRDSSSTSANAGTQARFVGAGSGVFASTTKAAASTGIKVQAVFSPQALNSDSRAYYGLTAIAGAGVINMSTEPSALLNVLLLGCDAADTNWQWMHNDGAGTATKVDTGIAKAALVGELLSLLIEIENGTVTMTLTNLESLVEYTVSPSTNLPAIDTLIYLTIVSGVGPTGGVAAAHEHVYYAMQKPLIG